MGVDWPSLPKAPRLCTHFAQERRFGLFGIVSPLGTADTNPTQKPGDFDCDTNVTYLESTTHRDTRFSSHYCL